MPDRKSVPICRQVMTNGNYCQCPALKDSLLCYYHQSDRQRKRNLQKAREIKRMTEPKREGFRPLDDLNTEIMESLDFPALDDKASVQIALTNILRAVYADHISMNKARLMLKSVTEASVNLRKGGAVFNPYFQPGGLVDPDPVKPLGDDEGYVLPEEADIKKSMALLKATLAAREQAAREQPAREQPDAPPTPPAPASVPLSPAAEAEKSAVG